MHLTAYLLLEIKRPLQWVPESNEAQATVNIHLNQITIDIPLEKLTFLTGIMSGNMSELPLRPDENELKLVFEFLQSVNFKLIMPEEQAKIEATPTKQAIQSPTQAKVNLTLNQVSISLLAGNGVTYDGYSLRL